MEKHFNGERLIQAKRFVNDLNGDWKTMTVEHIRKNYFKNSKQFTTHCLGVLEGLGLIEVDRPGRSYVNGKWINNANRYRNPKFELKEVEPEVIITDDGRFILISDDDIKSLKSSIKISFSTFDGWVTKEAIKQEALINGLDEEKFEYLWLQKECDKYLKKHSKHKNKSIV